MSEEILEEIRQVNKNYPDGIYRKTLANDIKEILSFEDIMLLIKNIFNLQNENKKLKSQLQQKENIIKEVREKINHYELIIGDYDACYDGVYDTYSNYDLKEDMLKILDKENK